MIKLSTVSGEGPSYGEGQETVRKAIIDGIKITKEELIAELKNLAQYGDDGERHQVTDLLILQYLDDKEIFDLWDNFQKWFE